jgi:hypothetical protein
MEDQAAQHQKWWQKIKRPLSVIGIIAASLLVIALIVGIIGGYLFNWKGIGVGQKTLWDWMQLLFIPVVLAVAGFWFNHRERRAAELRAESDQEIEQHRNDAAYKLAVNTQQENRLQTYLDNMSQLLLVFNLRKSEINDEVRYIARARTLTVLSQLDTSRKQIVIQFLYESNLISKNVDGNIISLEGADLDGDYPSLTLRGAYLHNLVISESNFDDTNLSEADLSDSSLNGCHMVGCNLSNSNLLIS